MFFGIYYSPHVISRHFRGEELVLRVNNEVSIIPTILLEFILHLSGQG